MPPNPPFEADLRKRASPLASAAAGRASLGSPTRAQALEV
jgi:hypothetical protein